MVPGRKWIIGMVAVVISLIGGVNFHATAMASNVDEEEIIDNGDFELLNADGFPASPFYVSRFTGNAEITSDDQTYRSPGHSVRIEGDGETRIALSTPRMDVIGGETYKFTVWYRSAEGVPRSRDLLQQHIMARLQAYFINEFGEREKVLWDVEKTRVPQSVGIEVAGGSLHLFPLLHAVEGKEEEWHALETIFKLPEETSLIQVNLFNRFGNEAIWYDDLSLVRLPGVNIEWDESGNDDSTFESDGSDVPSDLMLDSLNPHHPRLFASSTDFAQLRERLQDEALTMEFAKLQVTANSMLSQAPSTYELPDGKRLMRMSQQVLDRVEILGLMFWLTGESRYAERAWRELEAAARFPDWNPHRHFLDTAEMTRAFAIGYDWLYDVWTEEQRATIREAIVEKGLLPALEDYRGTAPWVTRNNRWAQKVNNWNFVVNSGISMGALAVAEDFPELAEELLRRGLNSIRLAIDRFGPDGGWDEGVNYWNYSVRYLIPYIAVLETALGSDFGLADTPGIAETGYFPIYLIGPTGTFNFGDAQTNVRAASELYWLANRFDVPAYAWWQKLYSSEGDPSARNLLWHPVGNDDLFSLNPDQLPLDRYFREVEVVSFRSAWQQRRAAFVALKAGINAKHHNDLDVGTFVFDALGVRWAEDLGSDHYDLPSYMNYNGPRWTYYRKRAEGQNTIVLNPSEKPDQDLLASRPARFLFQTSTPSEAIAVADLTPAYVSHADRVLRGIALFDERRQVLIQDEIRTPSPTDFWWFMHTKTQIEISESGTTAILRQGDKRLEARILSPEDATFHVRLAEPLPTSPNPPGQGVNHDVRKLAIHLEDVTCLRLVVQLTPLEIDEYAPITPEVIPLSQWDRINESKGLWGPLPRLSAVFPASDDGRTVFGKAPVTFNADDLKAYPVEEFIVQIDGEVLYSQPTPPENIVVDTRQLTDGTYDLGLRFVMTDGTWVEQFIPMEVENLWRMSDAQLPPISYDWFGELDRSQTSEASAGWIYVTDQPEDYFGDSQRRVRKNNTTEYLVWETPNVDEFEITMFSMTPDLDGVLGVGGSKDGQEWSEIAYEVTIKDRSDNNGRYELKVTAVDLSEEAFNVFKLTLHESNLAAEDVQIGHVELVGWKE